MEEWQLSSSRRHGNGLLDRLSSLAPSRPLTVPGDHVRNRWSSLKAGYPFSAVLKQSSSERMNERSVH
jgi:hypothetical protein